MLTDHLIIRRATADDAAALSAFGRRVFTATFEAENNPADLAAYLDGAYTVTHQQADIADPSIDTLLLEIDGALAAFAQVRVSEMPPCVGAPAALELARLYVDHGWHGRGRNGWRDSRTGRQHLADDGLRRQQQLLHGPLHQW